jgi:tetratricopeptide (TPR) repeat protein
LTLIKGVIDLTLNFKLLTEYGLSLLYKGKLNDSFKQFDQAIHIANRSNRSKEEKLEEIMNLEFRLFSYAVASHDTKNFKKSIKIFKKLNIYFPENGKYSIWLNEIRAKIASKITRPLFVIYIIWLIGDLTFFNYFDYPFRFNLTLIGAIFLTPLLATELYLLIVKKKKESYG